MEELKEFKDINLRRFFPDYKWNYIADAILEGSTGKVLVNNQETPSVVILNIPEQKIYILGGDEKHPTARKFIADLPGLSMLLLGKQDWKSVLEELQNGKLITLKRFAFSSSSLQLDQLNNIKSKLSNRFQIKRIELAHAQQIMTEKSNLTDGQLFGFSSAEDFMERGFGYCAFENEKMICIASTGAVCSKGIEVQINTHEKYRGQGLASATGAALIIECLEKGIDPNWDAATEISAGLAKKLGYLPESEYEMYVYTGSRFLVILRTFLRRIRGKEV